MTKAPTRNMLVNVSVQNSILIEKYLMLALPCLALLLAFTIAWRKKKSVGHQVGIFLFWAYLCALAMFTLTPFPMEFSDNGEYFTGLHLVPALLEGNPQFRLENRQVWGNFLAGVPFGIMFPFVVPPPNCTFRRRAAFGLLLAIAPEFGQLLQNVFMTGYGGRAVDIDDVWLCFAGTICGYGILWLIAHFYVRLDCTSVARLSAWNHFHDVLIRIATTPARTRQ